MIAEVACLLKENKRQLPYGLYVVNAVQEEIGLLGAEMIARQNKNPMWPLLPMLRTTPYTPMINKIIEGDVGLVEKAHPLAFGPAVHNKPLKPGTGCG